MAVQDGLEPSNPRETVVAAASATGIGSTQLPKAGSSHDHSRRTRVDNNKQEAMAARDGLEPRNPNETVFAVSDEWNHKYRMQTEHRMNECSLAEEVHHISGPSAATQAHTRK